MKRFCLHLLGLGVAMLAPAALAAGAQSTAPTTRPFDRELTVSPARAEQRATDRSFAFSQATLDLRDENAATLYLQAIAHSPRWTAENSDEWNSVYDADPEERDPAKVEALLEQYRSTFNLIEPAVRRTWVDWGSPIEEQGVATLLPYLNHMRQLANAMSIDIDYRISRGEEEQAVDTLRRLYVFAGHVGNARQPLVIDGLVGVALAGFANTRAARLIEQPWADNYYWAFTTIPTPMFDVISWMQTERQMILVSFPELRDPESATAESWALMFDRFRYFQNPGANDTPPSLQQAFGGAALALSMVPAAEQFFKERGYSDEQITEMGLYPMVARYMRDDYLERFDEFLRLLTLPYPQARQGIAELEARNERELGSGIGSLLAKIALPSLGRAVAHPYRFERDIAALRIVEAVRDYAADHDGSPPPSLDEVRLPIPTDPMTGEPFGYSTDGNSFTLSAEPYDPQRPDTGLTWRVHLRQAGETDDAAADDSD